MSSELLDDDNNSSKTNPIILKKLIATALLLFVGLFYIRFGIEDWYKYYYYLPFEETPYQTKEITYPIMILLGILISSLGLLVWLNRMSILWSIIFFLLIMTSGIILSVYINFYT
jgi:hypothetical protein